MFFLHIPFLQSFRGWEWNRTTGTLHFHTTALPAELPQPYINVKEYDSEYLSSPIGSELFHKCTENFLH